MPHTQRPKWNISIAASLALVTAASIGMLGASKVASDAPERPTHATTTPTSTTTTPMHHRQSTTVPARTVSQQRLARLPKATTYGILDDAPPDRQRHAPPSGLVVHPRTTVPVLAKPGGPAIAALPPTQLRAGTWLPVIAEHHGWLRVLLPTRPNGSTGWLAHDPRVLRLAHTPYRIQVDRDRYTLTLLRNGKTIATWTAGVGKPGAVTPAGRTFVLAAIRDTKATFSNIVLPLGAHSDTFTTYGGGPGTVAIHTWPTRDALGTATSDGCIRIPQTALNTLSTTVPLGTPVLIH